MQENIIKNDDIVHVTKISKLAIVTFSLAIIFLICTFTIGFEYTDYIGKLISIFTDCVAIYLFYIVMKRTEKKRLGGYKIAKIALIVITFVLVADWISAIPLSTESKSLNNFATTVSPTFFGNNLETIRTNGNPNIMKLLSYEDETNKMRDDFDGIGKVTECSFDVDGTYSKVKFGPVTRVNKLNYLVTGEYLIRCYGDKKAIDLTIYLTKGGDQWKIDSFGYNSDLLGNASTTPVNNQK